MPMCARIHTQIRFWFSFYHNKLGRTILYLLYFEQVFNFITNQKKSFLMISKKNSFSTCWNHYILVFRYPWPHPGIWVAAEYSANQSLIADATRKFIAWKRQTIRKGRTQSHWPKSRGCLGYGSRVAGQRRDISQYTSLRGDVWIARCHERDLGHFI